jgi:hypothetical protein
MSLTAGTGLRIAKIFANDPLYQLSYTPEIVGVMLTARQPISRQ